MPQINPFSVVRHGTKGHMSQVNPFSVVRHVIRGHMSHKSCAPGQPLLSCEARYLKCSVPLKGILLAKLILIEVNWPPHPTPKGWGGQFTSHLFCFVDQ